MNQHHYYNVIQIKKHKNKARFTYNRCKNTEVSASRKTPTKEITEEAARIKSEQELPIPGGIMMEAESLYIKIL